MTLQAVGNYAKEAVTSAATPIAEGIVNKTVGFGKCLFGINNLENAWESIQGKDALQVKSNGPKVVVKSYTPGYCERISNTTEQLLVGTAKGAAWGIATLNGAVTTGAGILGNNILLPAAKEIGGMIWNHPGTVAAVTCAGLILSSAYQDYQGIQDKAQYTEDAQGVRVTKSTQTMTEKAILASKVVGKCTAAAIAVALCTDAGYAGLSAAAMPALTSAYSALTSSAIVGTPVAMFVMNKMADLGLAQGATAAATGAPLVI